MTAHTHLDKAESGVSKVNKKMSHVLIHSKGPCHDAGAGFPEKNVSTCILARDDMFVCPGQGVGFRFFWSDRRSGLVFKTMVRYHYGLLSQYSFIQAYVDFFLSFSVSIHSLSSSRM